MMEQLFTSTSSSHPADMMIKGRRGASGRVSLLLSVTSREMEEEAKRQVNKRERERLLRKVTRQTGWKVSVQRRERERCCSEFIARTILEDIVP